MGRSIASKQRPVLPVESAVIALPNGRLELIARAVVVFDYSRVWKT